MKSLEQVKRFVELRAEGWSLTHISKELKIHRNTLIRWGNEYKRPIEKLHQAELEALAEKLIKRPEDRARALAAKLQEIEAELDRRAIKELSTARLFTLANALHRQIQRELGHAQYATRPAKPNSPTPPPKPASPTQPAAEQQSVDYEQAVAEQQRREEERKKKQEELAKYYGLTPQDCRELEEADRLGLTNAIDWARTHPPSPTPATPSQPTPTQK
jgi:hypothetical protein